jgi:diguanylate cyclase (GGDEF)-like protein
MLARTTHRLVRPAASWTFVAYATATAVAAVVPPAVFGWARVWRIDAPALFWFLSSLVIVGELLPIPVPRRHGLARVTISSAFALAILLRFGAGAAIVVYVVSLVVADGVARVAPIKLLFNAGQYALSLTAAAGVLMATNTHVFERITAHQLPAVLAAALAFFAVNHLLTCVGAALFAGLPVRRYIFDDLAFQAWTAGCLVAFAPAVLASAQVSLALVPVAFVPMLAIYMGGRAAAVNAHHAYHDSLTELPNRLLLGERLESALGMAAHDEKPLAVMLLDIDEFKAINDTLGHELGDAVLKRIAGRFSDAVGDRGMLARLGGDEFAVLIEGDQPAAARIADDLLEALSLPLEIDSLWLHVSASIGMACFPAHGETGSQLLRHADIALYCAKESDGTIRTYDDEHDEYSIDRRALAIQLRRGMERGELLVHYQPKVPLREGGKSSVEALARWNHPQLGPIGPDAFIPLAERTGIITRLTEKVMESALGQCAQWRSEGLDVSVAVNVSTRSLLDHELPEMIRDMLERYELPPRALQIEITETRIVADLPRARATLDELREMGVMIAIDDFGTGFSSLSQLQQLPIDEIKIDRSFVMGMDNDRNDAVLVRSIIELARNLGLRVTAEGVETEETTLTLRRLGCDFAQGFHVGRPMAAEQCRRLLEPAATGPAAAVVALPARAS